MFYPLNLLLYLLGFLGRIKNNVFLWLEIFCCFLNINSTPKISSFRFIGHYSSTVMACFSFFQKLTTWQCFVAVVVAQLSFPVEWDAERENRAVPTRHRQNHPPQPIVLQSQNQAQKATFLSLCSSGEMHDKLYMDFKCVCVCVYIFSSNNVMLIWLYFSRNIWRGQLTQFLS